MSDANTMMADLMRAKLELAKLGRPVRLILIHKTLWDQLMKLAPKITHPTFADAFACGVYANGTPVQSYTSPADALQALAWINATERVGVLLPSGAYVERTPYAALAEISQATRKPETAPEVANQIAAQPPDS